MRLLAAQPDTAPAAHFLPEMLMMLGVVLIAFLLVISVRGKIARRNSQIISPRERIESIKSAASARQDTDALKAELHNTARDLAARLANRAQLLEQLITQADQRIAHLQQIQSPDTTRPLTAAPRQTAPPAASENVHRIDPHLSASSRSPATNLRHDAIDPLTRSVYELADRGHPPVEIARELNEQTGKIELILALRKSA